MSRDFFPAGGHSVSEKAEALHHDRDTLKGEVQTTQRGVEGPRKATLPHTQPQPRFEKIRGNGHVLALDAEKLGLSFYFGHLLVVQI